MEGTDASRDAGDAEGVAGESVDVESLSSEGDGVGRLADGRVVFVEGAVPGDRVALIDPEESRRFVRARIGALGRASADRVEPACPHFDACGGCQWQQIAYPAQLEAKRRIVRDALERIGRIRLEALPAIVASPSPWGYRARARWVEAEEGLGYRTRGSHAVCVVDRCPVLVPAAEAALSSLGAATRTRASESALSRPVSDRHGAERGRRREWIVTAPGPAHDAEAIVLGPRHAGRPPAVVVNVAGHALRVSGASFVQGNALLWESLVDAVRDACLAGADASDARSFVEIYSGVGFFTVPIAAAGAEGVAFESDRSALFDLAYNLRRAGLDERVQVLRGRVETRGDLATVLRDRDFVLVDPPRAGLAKPVRAALAAGAPPRIVYLSCDPGTLARDVADLSKAGYGLRSAVLFDLFPQTAHVETLATLELESRAR